MGWFRRGKKIAMEHVAPPEDSHKIGDLRIVPDSGLLYRIERYSFLDSNTNSKCWVYVTLAPSIEEARKYAAHLSQPPIYL